MCHPLQDERSWMSTSGETYLRSTPSLDIRVYFVDNIRGNGSRKLPVLLSN